MFACGRGGHLPKLQCPTQQSSQGGHYDPGYSVPPYNRAKGDTLIQAPVSHQSKVYTLTSVPPNTPAKGDTMTQVTVSHLG